MRKVTGTSPDAGAFEGVGLGVAVGTAAGATTAGAPADPPPEHALRPTNVKMTARPRGSFGFTFLLCTPYGGGVEPDGNTTPGSIDWVGWGLGAEACGLGNSPLVP